MNGESSMSSAVSAVLTEVPAVLLSSLGEWLTERALQLQEPGADAVRLGAELEQLGLEVQGLVHALQGRKADAGETVDLQAAAQASIRQWQPAFAAAGLTLQLQDGPPVRLTMDGGLLQHALDLLLAHALERGQASRLEVLAGVPAGLRMCALGVPQPGTRDEVHGLLLRLLARTRAWGLRRVAGAEGGEMQTELHLASTVPSTSSTADASLPRRHLDTSLRVLVLDPDEASRVRCARLLTRAGLQYDCLPGVAQALAALEQGDTQWTALVSGIGAGEPGMLDLVQTLRLRGDLTHWIELVDEDYRFDIDLADGSRPARIGRQNLDNTLLPALAG
jgi:hypothetical protein